MESEQNFKHTKPWEFYPMVLSSRTKINERGAKKEKDALRPQTDPMMPK